MKLVFNPNLRLQKSGITYLGGGAPLNAVVIKKSSSPITLWKHFQVYESGREGNKKFFSILYDVLDSVFNFRSLKVVKNEKGDVLAGFTYKLRKNKMDERSVYVDSIARNQKAEFNDYTKTLMTSVYSEIKKTAAVKKAKEITLFVYSGEKHLRQNYERLGFKIDNKCDVKKVYLMRTPIDKFLNNKYFKCRMLKEALGVDSMLRT